MHDPRLECHRTKRKKDSCRRVLNEHARTPINTSAAALLINRAERDAEQSYYRRYPRERRSPTCRRLVFNDEIHASNTEEKATPLLCDDPLAEQAIGDGRGEQGLQPHYKCRYGSG